MIPKILHLYWDKSPMAMLQVFTVTSFHRLNPDWEINVYTPLDSYNGEEKYVVDYTGEDYFYMVEALPYVKIIPFYLRDYKVDSNVHNIIRSDIFRYKILHKYGGWWSDFDVLWLKPMTHLSNIKSIGNIGIDDMGSFVCMLNGTCGHHNISIMASAKEHPFIKSLEDRVAELQRLEYTIWHQVFGTQMLNDLYPELPNVTDKFNDVVGIYYETFFPYSIFELDRLYFNEDDLINDNVMCIHWFNGHQWSKEYINKNGFDTQCSLTTILKREGYI